MKSKLLKDTLAVIEDNGLLGNKNTNKLHSIGCSAILMMAEKNKVYNPNPDGFIPCLWCHAGFGLGGRIGDQMLLEDFNTEQELGIEACHDKRYLKIFDKLQEIQKKRNESAILCGNKSHQAFKVKMYPHTNGVEVKNRNGKFWVYAECIYCGYQLALWKAERIVGIKEFKK